jgi:cytochrome c2
MNRSLIRIVCLGCAFAILPLLAHPREKRASRQSSPSPSAQLAASADASQGERVFKQNCARCHDAPQGFSPRISGTVIRHMRVRASLAAEDEKKLLKFLNP